MNQTLGNKVFSTQELEEFYPLINLEGKKVKYDPNKYELEVGDVAEYLDKNNQITRGLIEKIGRSRPMNYPIYHINGEPHMYCKIWPKVDEKGTIISYKDKIDENKKQFLKKVNKELNKANLSEDEDFKIGPNEGDPA
ncbi:hypothetical protein KAI04_01935 [Candidatus Pacearchaeota archaeon]|nr:hypothetical protein [Candidatus Pacearchaeota archaeon]